MKVSRLEKTYVAILMVIFGGIVLHAPLSVGLGVLFPSLELAIKAWKEVLMLVATALGVVIVTRRQMWRQLLGDWVLRLIAAFAALHLFLVGFFYQGWAATVAGLMIDLRFLLFFGLVYMAIKIAPQYRRRLVQIAVAGACIVVGFATLQLFLPPDILSHIGYSRDTIMPYLTVDKNPDYVRVNSTLRGPNPLGAYAGIALGLLAAALARGKLQPRGRKALFATAIFATCSLVALWTSYSRSAWAAGIVILLVVVVVGAYRKVSRRVWIASAVVVFALAGALVAVKGNSFVSNVLLHENPQGGSAVSSNEAHVESLETGTRRLFRHPFGQGVGSAGSASLLGDRPTVVENQYLFVAHETGWLGMGLFVTLYGLVLYRLWKRRSDWLSLGVFASGIGLALIGLLLPVWADDTVSIVWWGLTAIALAGGKHGRKQAK